MRKGLIKEIRDVHNVNGQSLVLIHSSNPVPQGLMIHIPEEMLVKVPDQKLTRRVVGGYIQSKLPTKKYKRPDSAVITVSVEDGTVIGIGNLVSKKTGERLRRWGANILDIEEDS
jgi:predicted RNA binding protein YcfA (HicA-like mRNA interferase family)